MLALKRSWGKSVSHKLHVQFGDIRPI